VVYLGDFRKNGCCEVTISYYSCCRSTSITTGAANNSFYVDAIMNVCQSPCDNSPVFTNAPIAILCLGRDFIYNQGVTDFDVDSTTGGLLDSMVYSFADPMRGAGQSTPWSGGFSAEKPLTFLGFPKTSLPFPRGFHLDTFTGDMMFRPMKVEITVFAIKIEQYRNGKKISETRRDVQIIVIKCPDNDPPVISGINCSSPKPNAFKAQACAGQTLCFTICTSDKDKDDTVTISWNAGIPGAIFTVVNKGDRRETGRFCWTPTEAHVSKFPYTFVATAKDNACPVNGFTARSFQVIVKESPKLTYDTLAYDCGNARFTVERRGKIKITQYLWVFNGNTKVRPGSDKDTVYTRFKYPGPKPFAVTAFGSNGCNTISEDTITIPKYINTTTTDYPPVCAGSQVTVSAVVADSVGPVDFKWAHTSSTKRTTTITVGTRDTFVVALVDDGSCTNSDTTFIQVNRPPVVDLGIDQRICPGTTYQFGVGRTIDTTDADTVVRIEWYQGGLTNFLLEADSITLKDSATYYIKAIDSLGCYSVDSVRLFVNPLREWQPKDQAICIGDSAILEMGDQTLTSRYWWYGSPGDTANPIATGPLFGDLPTTSKWYGVKWSEIIGGLRCTEYDSVSVKVNPLPELKLNLPVELCENHGAFSLSLVGTPYGGVWFDTAKTRDYIRGNVFYTTEAKADGKNNARHLVGYTYTDLVTGCLDTTYGVVVVKPLPELALSEDTLFVCNTEIDRELGQYVMKVAGKGSWQGPGVVLDGGKYRFVVAEVGPQQQAYTLTYGYTDNNGAQPWCSNQLQLVVNVIEVPEVAIERFDSVCVDAPLVALDKASPTGKTGAWYYQGTDGSRWDMMDDDFDPSTYGAGKHRLAYVYRVPGSVCADTGYAVIGVNPLPQPIMSTAWEQVLGENRICLSADAKTLKGSVQDVNSNFVKMVFAGRGVSGSGNGPYMFTPKDAGLGTHTLTYDVENIYGCKARVSQNVGVDDVKEVSYSNSVVCLGDTVNLMPSHKNATDLEWSTDGQGQFVDKGLSGARYVPLGTDLSQAFHIWVKTVNPNNICPDVEHKAELEVYPLPVLGFVQSDTLGCAPLRVDFENKTTIERGEIAWVDFLFGNGQRSRVKGYGSTTATTYGVVGSNDRYRGWMVAGSDVGCRDSAKFGVTTLLLPKPAYTPQPGQTTIIDPAIYFENKSEYVVDENTGYAWYFDDHMASDGGNSTDKDVLYSYTDTGHYQVKLYAANYHVHSGLDVVCIDSITHTVVVLPEVVIYVPNVFTPNADGPEANNVFKPVISNALEYNIKVYDRWGERMWESEDLAAWWDGTYKGQDCELGVYLYVIKVKNEAGTEYEFSGTVTLLR
jgi:gliding motility-associated-like protein